MELNEQSTLSELFPSESCDYIKEVVSYYTNNLGKRILFIFDGYDEVHKCSNLERSLLLEIVFGRRLQNCSVLITSRPYASGYLKAHSRFNRHVEVLGFSTEMINKCIEQSLSDSNQASRLIEMLRERLDIVSLCYIPLNCRIVLFIYKILGYALPNTLTELYETFILHTIKRHAEKDEATVEGKETIHRAESISKLPLKLTEKFMSLCELAFNSIKENKLSFSDQELEYESVLTLGLLNSYQTTTLANVQRHFEFLHLTIQEFLAAMFLSSNTKFTPKEIVTFVQTHIQDSRFKMTILFLAGLTKLNFHTTDYLINSEAAGDLDSKMLKGVNREEETRTFLLCAHCAYEAELVSNDEMLSHLFTIMKSKDIIFCAQTISPLKS